VVPHQLKVENVVVKEEAAEAAEEETVVEEASVTEAAEEAVEAEVEEVAQLVDSEIRITGLHLPNSEDW